jgi:hypothetical protein
VTKEKISAKNLTQSVVMPLAAADGTLGITPGYRIVTPREERLSAVAADLHDFLAPGAIELAA